VRFPESTVQFCVCAIARPHFVVFLCAFCFNLDCGDFILFCDVCVCVRVRARMCGFCNVCVFW
jgi:hypothetical protein